MLWNRRMRNRTSGGVGGRGKFNTFPSYLIIVVISPSFHRFSDKLHRYDELKLSEVEP